LADRAVLKEPGLARSHQLARAVLYRAERFDEALKHLQEAEGKDNPGHAASLAYVWYFRAMAHERLGEQEEAARYLAKAVEEAERERKELEAGGQPAPWFRKFALQLLRTEAEALLHPPPNATPPEARDETPSRTVNTPIVSVKKELYRKHPEARVAAWAAVQYIGPRLEVREVQGIERRSDVEEKIRVRWSEDNGRTWSEFADVQPSTEVKYAGVTVTKAEGPVASDPASGLLVQAWLRQIEDKGVFHNFTYWRTSSDNGRTWGEPRPFRYEDGPAFDPREPLKREFLGRNEGYFGNNILVRSDGSLIFCLAHANADGDAENDRRSERLGSVLFTGKWDKGKKDYEWTAGARTAISAESSARGLMEPEVAELKDGRLLVVWRGSNRSWKGTPAKLPGRKFFSISTDGGRTLGPPGEWRYDDGTAFYSPSSYHRMLRHSTTGKLYWLGNISAAPPDGNSPRYPPVIAEVDETKAALKKATVTAIDDRQPGQGNVQFSNFSLHEDRETHALILYLTTYGQEADPKDWATADCYRYTLTLK
jgi:hypothetical protein